MKNLTILLVGTVLLGCAPHLANSAKMAIADLHNPQGQHVGIATLTEGHDGVRIAVNLYNMPPGTHAFHIHAAGSCESPDFKSAKGHFNPFGRKHGLKSADGPHAGDLLNITIAADGTGAAIVTAPMATLGKGDNSLFREGGTAIMIHDGPDDYVSDPAGNAGPRIACGLIREAK
ncbi:MAG: superoxide dismutase family protein [Candidatus Krumholzibacteria bacterium]|nr:superoxide dismutase family protein [Candidatus Krumholzibacteria bacterium]